MIAWPMFKYKESEGLKYVELYCFVGGLGSH